MADEGLQKALAGVSELSGRIGAWLEYFGKYRDVCGQIDLLLAHARQVLKVDADSGERVCDGIGWAGIKLLIEDITQIHFDKLSTVSEDGSVPINTPSGYLAPNSPTPGALLAALQDALKKLDDARVKGSAPTFYDALAPTNLVLRKQQVRCAEHIRKESIALVGLVGQLENQLRAVLSQPNGQ